MGNYIFIIGENEAKYYMDYFSNFEINILKLYPSGLEFNLRVKIAHDSPKDWSIFINSKKLNFYSDNTFGVLSLERSNSDIVLDVLAIFKDESF